MDEMGARAVAQRHLDDLSYGQDEALLLVPGEVIRTSYGWVFFFNSEGFLLHGDESARLAGNGPLVVLDRDQSVHALGTADSIAEVIAEFERQMSSVQETPT